MKTRCTNPKATKYADYGGRGIRVCDAWLTSFEAFLTDVGTRPSRQHSLDRIDNNGNYEPGNVRWSTVVRQNYNRRSNHLITHNGVTLTLTEWAQRLGITRSTLSARFNLRGWTIDKAMSSEIGDGSRLPPRFITHNGMTMNLTQWAKHVGISHSAIHRRLKAGWPLQMALHR